MFRDFGRILLLPRGWERGIAMPIAVNLSLQLPSATVPVTAGVEAALVS